MLTRILFKPVSLADLQEWPQEVLPIPRLGEIESSLFPTVCRPPKITVS